MLTGVMVLQIGLAVFGALGAFALTASCVAVWLSEQRFSEALPVFLVFGLCGNALWLLLCWGLHTLVTS